MNLLSNLTVKCIHVYHQMLKQPSPHNAGSLLWQNAPFLPLWTRIIWQIWAQIIIDWVNFWIHFIWTVARWQLTYRIEINSYWCHFENALKNSLSKTYSHSDRLVVGIQFGSTESNQVFVLKWSNFDSVTDHFRRYHQSMLESIHLLCWSIHWQMNDDQTLLNYFHEMAKILFAIEKSEEKIIILGIQFVNKINFKWIIII